MRTFAVLTTLSLVAVSLCSPIACPYLESHGISLDSRDIPGDVGHEALKKRGLPQILGAPANLLDGILGGVAAVVDPNQKRPEPGYNFIAPGPTDQRGPCPGLNTLANHGYLNRSGIVRAGDVITATERGFNMGPDLSALLVTIAVAFGGNIETEVFSLGGEDDRTYSATGIGSKAAGRQYGLDAHSRCEGDISATREDYYLNNGDDHNGSPRRFARFIETAKANGGQFNVPAANQLFGINSKESIAYNPRLYFQAYTIVVVLGEYPFLPNFFSNGTYGAGGDSNFESLAPLMGYTIDNATQQICYQPERFPDNWYRRTTPYGVAQLVEGLVPTYLAAGKNLPLPNPLGALLQNNAQTSEITCAVYQGIFSGIPTAVGATAQSISDISTYVSKSLFGPSAKPLFGCDISEPSIATNSSNPNGNQYASPLNNGGSQSQQICGFKKPPGLPASAPTI
ncbi:uncharacterized protein L969DRAFT_77894 [Mixia osmundae IAM 14324]|uniref:Heme haloperoxidase family profile domain-containing protein n=1 Tax=Mixia osmundae (strain CBS 9802 / IAM 14324 / JCM 22182 / KY 12970) TaxID=764103 RepID=G7E4S1_MIXOS|nr:uncharacterized protein L969DRAFT_77894 [Mixia osmundae IAM 14324]KEI37652.1 hypothetical protein L969DRAFT_77894 [Mixia osmundae IAM 14324]GAA97831.1 hypothetical protein E5Q_04510 [Mixia osmundae IAM 14324]